MASCGALIFGSPNAFADPVANYYLDPGYWKAMEWSQPESSALWKASGWEPLEGEGALLKDEHNGKVLKRRTLSMGGDALHAQWTSNDVGTFTNFWGEISRGDCLEIVKVFKTRFGSPITNDGTANFSFSPDAQLFLVSEQYQWDVGNTRISASCFGMTKPATDDSKKNNFLLGIEYTNLSATPKLIPKFALRCTQRIHVSNGGVEDSDMGDFEFWVDVHNKNVLNAHNIILSDPHSFHADDGAIDFSITNNGNDVLRSSVLHYSLNRQTGEIDGTAKTDGLPDATITGECDKVDSIQNKF